MTFQGRHAVWICSFKFKRVLVISKVPLVLTQHPPQDDGRGMELPWVPFLETSLRGQVEGSFWSCKAANVLCFVFLDFSTFSSPVLPKCK